MPIRKSLPNSKTKFDVSLGRLNCKYMKMFIIYQNIDKDGTVQNELR
jgi:hypothetical protein